MSAPNDGGCAFPCTPTDRSGQCGPYDPGMSLRDYFAAQAMAAHIGGNHYPEIINVAKLKQLTINQVVSRMAYESADAMLAARERKEDAK